ncbi:MAG: class I SAM-dependent methyltransferase [Hyphomicrobiales bacterium]
MTDDAAGKATAKSAADRLDDDLHPVDEGAILAAYRRYAPLYDVVFGGITMPGRLAAARHVNHLEGRVLEAGVGTGLSLSLYAPHLQVTGIDLSPEMLQKAREKVARRGLANVEALLEMDAGNLAFPDHHFDGLVAAYVMTVVPDPARVLAEFERVVRPGGMVVLVNHFSEDKGARARIEQSMAPFAAKLGWRPEFPVEKVLGRPHLELIEETRLPPFGLFKLLAFRRT